MTVNVQHLRGRARLSIKRRSLKPDYQYIFFTFFCALSIVGLPIAYAAMKEYHKYLKICLEEYEANHGHEKGAVYSHQPVTSLKFDYKWSNAKKAVNMIRTLLTVNYSHLNFDNLSERQNNYAKLTLDSLKLMFPSIQIYQLGFPLVIVLMFFSPSTTVIWGLVGLLVLSTVLVARPLIAYSQAFVMYERTHCTMQRDTDAEKAEIDAFLEKWERENKK